MRWGPTKIPRPRPTPVGPSPPGWGAPDDGGSDGGVPVDDEPVTFLDWSDERGLPLEVQVEQELPGRAFAARR